MGIKLGEIYQTANYICTTIHSYFDLSDNNEIKTLIARLADIREDLISDYDWAPHTGIGCLKYHQAYANATSTIVTLFFHFSRRHDKIDLMIDDCPIDPFVGRSGRLKMIECLTKKDRYKNIDRICNITGMSQHLVMSDIETITKWNELRRDVIKLVVDRGFDVSTEIEGILDLADTDILKIMQQLRRAGEIPPSRFYHKSKK